MRHDSRPGRDGPASSRGFTLIELMIVVAIAALLAVVALPSFKNQIQKARRADAKGALVTAAQMLERYSTEHGAAGYSTATVNDSAGPTVVYRSTTENGYYQLALSNVTPTTFLLTAVPQGGQASDSCANFTLDQNGVRNVTSMTRTSSDCW